MQVIAKAKAEEKKIGMTETWLRKHRPIYDAATRHPFILSIRDATVQSHSFKTWLVSYLFISFQYLIIIIILIYHNFALQAQDYLFVRAFVPFVASVLIKACKESYDDSDVEVILGGMASLKDELSWFKIEATKWGISLSDLVPQNPNKNYCR